MASERSETAFLACTIAPLTALGALTFVHLLSWFQKGIDLGLFNKTSREMWDSYQLDIVDTDWVLYIHVAVYSFQFAWLLYILLCIARRSNASKISPLVHRPVVPKSVLLVYTLGLAGLVGWVKLRDIPPIKRFAISTVSVGIVCFCVATALCLRAVGKHARPLREDGHPGDVWAVRVLVHNSITLIATWATMLTMFTMAHLLDMYQFVTRDIAQYIAVGIIMAYAAIWCSMDLFLTHNVTGCIVAPYVLTVIVFGMVCMKNWGSDNLHLSIGVIFLGISSLLLVLKVAVAIGRTVYKRKSAKSASLNMHQAAPGAMETLNGGPVGAPVERHVQYKMKPQELPRVRLVDHV